MKDITEITKDEAIAALDQGNPNDIVRVIRVIEYVGDRQWVNKTLSTSLHGEKVLGSGRTIRVVTVVEPEVIEPDEVQ